MRTSTRNFLNSLLSTADLIGTAADASYRKQKNKGSEDQFFSDGISEKEFTEIAFKTKGKIKRIENIIVDGPVVKGFVYSLSRSSLWSFKVDFNDRGHITGKYHWTQRNNDSNIAKRFGDLMKEEIEKRLAG